MWWCLTKFLVCWLASPLLTEKTNKCLLLFRTRNDKTRMLVLGPSVRPLGLLLQFTRCTVQSGVADSYRPVGSSHPTALSHAHRVARCHR